MSNEKLFSRKEFEGVTILNERYHSHQKGDRDELDDFNVYPVFRHNCRNSRKGRKILKRGKGK